MGHAGPGRYIALGLVVLLVLALAAAVVMLKLSKASLSADPAALAKLSLPLGGAQVQSVNAVSGPQQEPLPVVLSGDRIWPRKTIPAGRTVSIYVVVKRPGWNGWLTGHTQRLSLTLTTPRARLKTQYLTVAKTGPLNVQFNVPVASLAYGASPGRLTRHALPAPQSAVTVPRSGPAGSLYVAAAPRSWETATPQLLSWFPAGTAAGVVATPNPGTSIRANTPITLTFSKPYTQVLGRSMPPVWPITKGTWHPVSSHTIVFRPEGYGYGLGANVKVGLPSNVGVVGGAATWKVPPGSTLRLQQLLAQLGYLPVQFNSGSVGDTPAAQEAAAIHPPRGSFTWRWGNVPSALHNLWQPGTFGELTKGAIMAFENDHGMTADGLPGPQLWNAVIGAALAGHPSSFGYTFVQVSEGSPETEQTWHNGKTVAQGLVNTGGAASPTAQGVFAVFEHALSVTMEGTNPDGSHYDDPGVPYVSYFNGGDALHGFIRASYGFPQSDGCVEMPYSEASQVYPYTPIGTIVDVS